MILKQNKNCSVILENSNISKEVMDDIDLKICKILSEDGRASFAEIARQVHISRMAVRERVMNLYRKGVIQKFTILIDSKKVGLDVAVFLLVKVKPHELDNVAEKLVEHPNVVIVYATTGINALHVHAFVKDTTELERFIRTQIYTIAGVTEVESNILLKRYKSERTMLV